jgi:hypothetical protein
MDAQLLLVACSMFVAGILFVATSAIGMECYNVNQDFKNQKESNWYFLIANLVSAILTILIASMSMYFAGTKVTY